MGNNQSQAIQHDNDIYKQAVINQRLDKLFVDHKELKDVYQSEVGKAKTDVQKELEQSETQERIKFQQYLEENKVPILSSFLILIFYAVI